MSASVATDIGRGGFGDEQVTGMFRVSKGVCERLQVCRALGKRLLLVCTVLLFQHTSWRQNSATRETLGRDFGDVFSKNVIFLLNWLRLVQFSPLLGLLGDLAPRPWGWGLGAARAGVTRSTPNKELWIQVL